MSTCKACGGSGRVPAVSELTGEPGSRRCKGCDGAGVVSNLRDRKQDQLESKAVTLECDHCGDVAYEALDGMVGDGDGEACISCGFPGHASVDNDEPIAWWNASDRPDAACRRDDCDDCRPIREQRRTESIPEPAQVCTTCGTACGACYARQVESGQRQTEATIAVADVDDVLDALAASIADGEIYYEDIRGPVGAKRAALELLRAVRVGLAIDPSSERLRREPAPIGTVTCINCGRSSDDPTGSACPSGGGPKHDWEDRDPDPEGEQRTTESLGIECGQGACAAGACDVHGRPSATHQATLTSSRPCGKRVGLGDGVALIDGCTPGNSAEFGVERGPRGETWFEATPEDVARARLASAAPDLARVLYDLSRMGPDRTCAYCGSCGEDGIDGESRGSCASDCELDAALRRAGVR